MLDSKQYDEFFQSFGKVLLRCWIMGFILLFVWFGMTLLAGEFVYRLSGALYDLSKHEVNLISYCGIALLKVIVIVFFFFPWLAIRLVCKGKSA